MELLGLSSNNELVQLLKRAKPILRNGVIPNLGINFKHRASIPNFTFAEAKSAAQKGQRWRDLELTLSAVSAMLLMAGSAEVSRTGKAMVTNLLNRLAITLCEDLAIYPEVFSQVLRRVLGHLKANVANKLQFADLARDVIYCNLLLLKVADRARIVSGLKTLALKEAVEAKPRGDFARAFKSNLLNGDVVGALEKVAHLFFYNKGLSLKGKAGDVAKKLNAKGKKAVEDVVWKPLLELAQDKKVSLPQEARTLVSNIHSLWRHCNDHKEHFVWVFKALTIFDSTLDWAKIRAEEETAIASVEAMAIDQKADSSGAGESPVWLQMLHRYIFDSPLGELPRGVIDVHCGGARPGGAKAIEQWASTGSRFVNDNRTVGWRVGVMRAYEEANQLRLEEAQEREKVSSKKKKQRLAAPGCE